MSPDGFIGWCLEHWLVLVNGFVLIYGGLPWLAPLLIALGYREAGEAIFLIYTPFCHQSPRNSFFLFGEQVAFCYREAAMFTGLLVGGLVYGQVRDRLRPASLWVGALLLLPLLIDGTTQTIDAAWPELRLRNPDDSLWSFNWWARMVTGLLFALTAVLVIYPRLERELRPPANEPG